MYTCTPGINKLKKIMIPKICNKKTYANDSHSNSEIIDHHHHALH